MSGLYYELQATNSRERRVPHKKQAPLIWQKKSTLRNDAGVHLVVPIPPIRLFVPFLSPFTWNVLLLGHGWLSLATRHISQPFHRVHECHREAAELSAVQRRPSDCTADESSLMHAHDLWAVASPSPVAPAYSVLF